MDTDKRDANTPTDSSGEVDYGTLLKSLLDSTTAMIQVFTAVRNQQGQIIDFVWVLNNRTAEEIYGDVIGKSLLSLNPGVIKEGIFETFIQVVETGVQNQSERHYVHEQFNGWFHQSTVKLNDGVATTTIDITERKQAEQEIRRLKDEATKNVADKYYSLFNSIDQGFHISELLYNQAGQVVDWRFLKVNPIFEHLTGLKNASGQLGSVMAPNTEHYWLEKYEQVVQTGEPLRFENYNAFTGRWYTVFVSRLGQASNHQFAVVFDDITNRKQYEQQQAYLLALSDALRSIADPVVVEETVTRMAMTYFEIDRCYYCTIEGDKFTIKRDALRGDLTSVAGMYPISSFPLLKKVVDEGQPFVVHDVGTTSILDEDLKALCFQLQVISFLNVPVIKNGKPVGVLCLVKSIPRNWLEIDIQLATETAERTWSAVERANAEEALKQADQRKDEFLAMLGHELRNPLGTLSNTLLLLGLTRGTDENFSVEEALYQMNREVKHLNRIVDDLLDVSRISKGKMKLHRESIELVAIVRQTVQAASSLYKANHRRLAVSLPSKPLYLEADETRIAQILMNLLSNSLKYTHEGGQVWVNLEQQNEEAILSVYDNGIGIAESDLRAIFDVFVQGQTTIDRPQGGLGLGLTMVKYLVEGYGGQIQAFSRGLNQGSEFVIHLPLLIKPVKPQQPVKLTGRSKPKKGQVLVVDDNKDLADMTAKLVSLQGYQGYARYSGQDALVAAEELHPDVMLLDLGMPYLDGYQVCQQIRQQPWGQRIVIIALTGYDQPTNRRQAQTIGFNGFLLKPLDLQALIDLLDKVIQQ
ncbi:hypothetical protein GCM10028805_00490 [Spirosoma harenae]